MIKVKHLMDRFESDDGVRVWVEPVALTRDLIEWCAVDRLVPSYAPSKQLARWFEKHPDEWGAFRGRYHQELIDRGMVDELRELAHAAQSRPITLLHQSADPNCNTAAALHDFLQDLQAWTSEP